MTGLPDSLLLTVPQVSPTPRIRDRTLPDMLVELAVQNLVIVTGATLAPGAGLTVISGETGAGKSLLLDALDLLLGGRAQAKLVGPAGDATTVTAVFQVSGDLATAVESACGVPPSDGQVIIRRRITDAGRSQAWINDIPVTAAALRAAGDVLVEIHAQHEALRLADPARQLALLDRFGKLTAQADAYAASHRRVLDLDAERLRLEGGERDSLKELDYLRFQAEEFSALNPQAGEVAQLEERVRLLSGAEQYRDLASQAAEALTEGDRSVAQVLGSLARKLSQAAEPRLGEASVACRQAAEAVQEAARLCADAADRLHADPGELARLQERLDAFYELMRKHGDGESALLEARERITARIAELEGLDARRSQVLTDLAAARDERERIGTKLAAARRKAFAKLADAVHAELADLGMPKAVLSLSDEAGDAGPLGLVRQELLVCTNPGLAPGRLGAIASGGEASRLTLALASALAEHDHTPVLVFDEVDSGVGGRLGTAIGAKLARLGRGRSVLAITHTPQLAAAAQRHYVVRKIQQTKRTTATVSEVTGADRQHEIAEMLGGGSAALGQAKSLLAGEAR